mgnify:FL=1
MTIPSSFIDQILDQSDIVDIVGQRVQLNKKGSNHWGLCPFHDDTNPSMAVNQDKQFYYCFVCNAKGNSINFLREYENLDFVDAVETIASSLGLEVPRTQSQQFDSNTLNVNEEAKKIFMDQLKSDTADQAKKYLQNRNISGKTALFFQLGYALNEWEGLFRKLSPSFSLPDLKESGIFSEKNKDRFRDRIMFPIRNIKGDCIAFGGRIIDQGEPKYLNSPETSTFSKSKELYGLYEARLNNTKLDSLFVVEGYMDVIALYEKGVTNSVATLGTAITSLHLSKLMRYTKEIYITFDGDKAGKVAAWRALENSLGILREDIRIKFIFLDDGHDPDSFINENGKDAFLALRDKAISLSEFFLNDLKSRDDLSTIEGRSNVAKISLSYINKIKNQTIKEAYISEISKICDLDLSNLVSISAKNTNAPAGDVNEKNTESQNSVMKKAILGIFAALIKNPTLANKHEDEIKRVDDKFKPVTDVITKFMNSDKMNPSIIFETIENEKIKNIFSEAIVSDLELNDEDASSMFLDCLNLLIKNQKDREEILKEKYNIANLDSAERRELQKIILKKHNITESDKELIRDLSKKN